MVITNAKMKQKTHHVHGFSPYVCLYFKVAAYVLALQTCATRRAAFLCAHEKSCPRHYTLLLITF
jgi:hypothetical protein